jgi:transcriptional regulator with XRE-family HTH domain
MDGTELKEAREAAGLTQEQVAAQMGIHRVTVIRWEQPKPVRKGKATRFLQAIADLTGQKAA